jgi:hypothetical protein
MAKMLTMMCPHCGLRLNVRQSSVNSVIRCKGCGGKILVEKASGGGGIWAVLGCLALVGFVGTCGLCLAVGALTPNRSGISSDAWVQNTGPAAEQPASEPATERAPVSPAAPPAPARDDQADAERKARERAEREAKERERFDQETAAYRVASAEYDAARKLRLVRSLAKDALEEKANGNFAGAERLLAKAQARYQEIVRDFPGTQGAADAQALLDGKDVAEHALPPLPVPPAPPALAADEAPATDQPKPPNLVWLLVQADQSALSGDSSVQLRTASGEPRTVTVYGRRSSARTPDLVWVLVSEEDAHALADAPASHSAPGDVTVRMSESASPKTVSVHGYYRKNGTYVHSYTRAAPGSGGRH